MYYEITKEVFANNYFFFVNSTKKTTNDVCEYSDIYKNKYISHNELRAKRDACMRYDYQIC